MPNRLLCRLDVTQETRTILVDQRMVCRPSGSVQFYRRLLHKFEVLQDFTAVRFGRRRRRHETVELS